MANKDKENSPRPDDSKPSDMNRDDHISDGDEYPESSVSSSSPQSDGRDSDDSKPSDMNRDDHISDGGEYPESSVSSSSPQSDGRDSDDSSSPDTTDPKNDCDSDDSSSSDTTDPKDDGDSDDSSSSDTTDPKSGSSNPKVPNSAEIQARFNDLCRQHSGFGSWFQSVIKVLKQLGIEKVKDMAHELMELLRSKKFYKALFNTLMRTIKEHPIATTAIVIGIVLMINPLALAGFGALGPIAGSIAAGWQATMGGWVVAGSAFAILQSLGMTIGVILPAIGAGVIGSGFLGAVAYPVVKNAFMRYLRWFKGEKGSENNENDNDDDDDKANGNKK